MAKNGTLKNALAAAKRQTEDSDMNTLVSKIVAGIRDRTDEVLAALQKRTVDRTDEVLNAVGSVQRNLESLEMPTVPTAQIEVDLGPVLARINALENKVAELTSELAASRDQEWILEHERDSRNRMIRTVAKPNG